MSVDSVLVHMAARPTAVRSWSSAGEWLPDLAAEASPERVELEQDPVNPHALRHFLTNGLRAVLATIDDDTWVVLWESVESTAVVRYLGLDTFSTPL